MFYGGLRLWGGLSLTKLCPQVGPLKKDLTCVGGSELRSYEGLMNVWRTLALGGSICCVSLVSEALKGSVSKGLSIPGGSAKEGPHVRGGSELGSYEDLMNVSRILALGGSICRVLRVGEALGGSSF